MRSKALILLLASVLAAGQWRPAQPGYRYQFPRDYFDHTDCQTEWWYYTGNLQASDGHRFGFELTFFRSALNEKLGGTAVWRPAQIYLAHLALTDIDGHTFYHDERINRAGPGLAGISFDNRRIWNGNWSVQWGSANQQQLDAVTDKLDLALALKPLKPVVINGRNGVDVKGPLPGEASHYLSFTRMDTRGTIRWKQHSFEVHGLAWMDHEFFTEPPDSQLLGWDWFAIQLSTGDDLMLYRLRRKSGRASEYSSGTYVDAHGRSQFIGPGQFRLQPGKTWNSPSGGRYPTVWNVSVPFLGLELTEHAEVNNQELYTPGAQTPSYWEGAVDYAGTMRGKNVTGVGYLEMTGYGRAVWLGVE